MNVYLAGPVVTKDKTIIAQMGDIEKMLRWLGFKVYRPGKHKVPNEWGIDMRTWAQCVFTMDVVAIDECDWMVVADYGRSATAGTAWEAGYAFAKGIKILVVQMPGVEESSLMTQGCAANICKYEALCSGIDRLDLVDKEKRVKDYFYERGRHAQEGECVLN